MVSDEDGMYEVRVFDWKTAQELKWQLPPTPRSTAVQQEQKPGVQLKSESKRGQKVANRQAAQRSRMKKLSYIAESETKCTELEELIDTLKSKMEALKMKNKELYEENASLQAELKARAIQSKMAERVTEELELEIARLRANIVGEVVMPEIDVGEEADVDQYLNLDFDEGEACYDFCV